MRKIGTALLGLMFCLAAHAGVQPGDNPPDALGTTQQGQPVTVSSLHGKVVVISFWATWCHYCMKEMPVLANLQTVASQRNLSLQVVAVNDQEDRRIFVQTVRALRPALPGLLMTWDRNGSLGRPYGTDKGIPVMVMLHRDGTVAHVHVGYGEDMLDSLVAEINTLLNEPPPASATVAKN
ncbi:TlpA family protein disulfide reductase [Rhodanobacter sp. Col0626]|uniref:TlpA family protein disulfide reductase n=1 Tax=Rhodanobacter sp. Col0626 TaxID=3415679 RepID=UPI003CEE4190